MSEETIDIHIRLSRDGAQMLESLMQLGRYTSKSAYIEQMILGIEDIFAGFYTFHHLSIKAGSNAEKLANWSMFTQYLLALLRRLGWVEYREQKDKEKKQGK